MSEPTILVVDDEKDLIELVRYNLEKNGFDVIGATTGQQGLEIARKNAPDLVLLDLMMPPPDGLEVCRQLRQDPRTAKLPVILLTARAAEADRVVGLEMGADDYVTKPFSPRELIARIRAVLRRFSGATESALPVQQGELVIDESRHEVTFRGRAVILTATEFRILHHLAARAGRVCSRTDIIDEALGRDAAVVDRTIDVHVTSIRKKLGKGGDLLETVRGFGYKLKEQRLPAGTRKAQ